MATQQPATTPCQVCMGLAKKEEDARLALDINPQELLDAVTQVGCGSCAVILGAATRFGETMWPEASEESGDAASIFVNNVSRIYVSGQATAQDTLCLELYSKKDQPKRTLELFYPEQRGYTFESRISQGPIRPRPSISNYPLSDHGINWARRLLHDCSLRHDCCPRVKGPELPKRILALKVSPTNGDISVRLVENSKKKAEYATLSYWWGCHQTCMTTSDTLEKHQDRVPWSELPQAFRDSIQFCLALGVHYIWIDSLCIVQDDIADWQTEEAQMADIYQNSFVTLAATCSDSITAGCFPGYPSSRVEFELDEESDLYIRGLAPAKLLIKSREKPHHLGGVANETFMQRHPLLARGWFFHQRILAPRVLHFCKDEMVWECNKETRCECGSLSEVSSPRKLFNEIMMAGENTPAQNAPIQDALTQDSQSYFNLCRSDVRDSGSNGVRPGRINFLLPALRSPRLRSPESRTVSPGAKASLRNRFRGLLRREGKLSLRSTHPLNGEDVPEQQPQPQTNGRQASNGVDPASGLYTSDGWLYKLKQEQPASSKKWQAIVEQFSSLLLFDPIDRLPALSGLTARLSPHLGQYLAGLWRSTLPHELMWRVSRLTSESHRTADKYGPSWSWASTSDMIGYWDDLRTEIAKPEVKQWLQRKPVWKSCTVEEKGRGFGEVTAGELVVEGHLQAARLQYLRTHPPTGDNDYDNDNDDTKVHDPLHYEVSLDNDLELPLSADYILSEEGPHYLVDGAELHLLLVHPDVCLVLEKLSEPRGGFPAYQRVGIVRQPERLTNENDPSTSWMASSVEDMITII